MISKAMDYALRAIVYMARQKERNFFGVKELARDVKVSPSYLGKVLQGLVKKGYLKSITGPGGGFALAKSPNDITLMDLIVAVDGKRALRPCFLGRADCNDLNPCPIHDIWKESRTTLIDNCTKTSVGQVMDKSWPMFLRRR